MLGVLAVIALIVGSVSATVSVTEADMQAAETGQQPAVTYEATNDFETAAVGRDGL
jgi:hypothetical protein